MTDTPQELTPSEQDLITIIEDGLWTAKLRREAVKEFQEEMKMRVWRA